MHCIDESDLKTHKLVSQMEVKFMDKIIQGGLTYNSILLQWHEKERNSG